MTRKTMSTLSSALLLGLAHVVLAAPPPLPPPLPSLEDERETYRRAGWTWQPGAEPDYPGEPSFTVTDPDVHGDTEGDDLWSYVATYQRTGEPGYLDRAHAWTHYFKEDYRNCVGGQSYSFCFDRDGYGADHMWGWGLVAYYEETGDAEALTEAERLAEVVETLHASDSPFGCYPRRRSRSATGASARRMTSTRPRFEAAEGARFTPPE